MIHLIPMLLTAIVTVVFCWLKNDNPITQWNKKDLFIWVIVSIIYPIGILVLIILAFNPSLLQKFKKW